MDHLKPGIIREFPPQMLHQQQVEFNGYHAVGPLQQSLGECAAAWTDFYHQRLPLRTRRGCDALQYRTFDQEMLTELLTGQRESLTTGVLASAIAILGAENRLHLAPRGLAEHGGGSKYREQNEVLHFRRHHALRDVVTANAAVIVDD